MSFTAYLESNLLKHVLDNVAYASPSNVYVSLWNGDPTNGGSEVTGSGYSRPTGSFTVSGSAATNNNNIEYVATGNWGLVDYVGVSDAATGGNLLRSTALTSSRTIINGDIVRFSIGDLDVSLT